MRSLYLAAKIKNLSEVFCLTSDVMHIADDYWLFDLSKVLPFWHHQCSHKKMSLAALLKQALAKIDEDFIAVAASHPWQGFLKIKFLEQRSFKGLVSLLDSLNIKIYENISFDIWLQTFEVFSVHFKDKKLKKNLALFKRSLLRLSLKKIADLKSASSASLEQRYGQSIALAMKWTFQYEGPNVWINDFLWNSYYPAIIPEVKRNLDYYMNSWGEISYHLGEDLNRLSKLFQQNVLKLQWVITLVDLTELNYEIDFRNPHSLSSEINSHDTSLRQFQFAFDKMVQEFKNKDELFMLSSWRIIASHLIATDFIERELLPASDLHDILKVENKLSSPFIRYTLTEDFMPEYSFKECDNFEQKNSSHPAIRPLFLFPQPREISTEISSANLVFTERVSTHWWDQDYQVRDYFLEKSIPARWVFWDHMSKKWYEHGLFG